MRLPDFILTRENSYIGTLIDDLITKPIEEPYRMLTSRSEYRLLLRQDNPTQRLSHLAHQWGLLTKVEFSQIEQQNKQIKQFQIKWKKQSTTKAQENHFQLSQKKKLIEIIKRPEFSVSDLEGITDVYVKELAQKAMIDIKYEGYIKKQAEDIKKINQLEQRKIPSKIDFDKIKGLRNEARDRFKENQPKTIYEAKRIAGINPADIYVLMMAAKL